MRSALRRASTALPAEMVAWQCTQYRSPLTLNTMAAVPVVRSPLDVLVRVEAASLNPLDARMADGYGREVLNSIRQARHSLQNGSCEPRPDQPLVLGRDLAGEVVSVGSGVRTLRAGDAVFGAIEPSRPGSFAQYALAPSWSLARRPPGLSALEAASLPFAGLTAAAALRRFTPYHQREDWQGKKVLIHGAAGGVGSLAVQMAAAWGARVFATAAADAAEDLKALGAEDVVDYEKDNAWARLTALCPFDAVLDGAGSELSRRSESLLGLWRGCAFVDLNSPLLKSTDRLGLPLGLASSVLGIAESGLRALASGRVHAWGYFVPDPSLLGEIAQLADQGKLKPVIGKRIGFSEVPDALLDMGGHGARGKTVVDVTTAEALREAVPASAAA